MSFYRSLAGAAVLALAATQGFAQGTAAAQNAARTNGGTAAAAGSFSSAAGAAALGTGVAGNRAGSFASGAATGTSGRGAGGAGTNAGGAAAPTPQSSGTTAPHWIMCPAGTTGEEALFAGSGLTCAPL